MLRNPKVIRGQDHDGYGISEFIEGSKNGSIDTSLLDLQNVLDVLEKEGTGFLVRKDSHNLVKESSASLIRKPCTIPCATEGLAREPCAKDIVVGNGGCRSNVIVWGQSEVGRIDLATGCVNVARKDAPSSERCHRTVKSTDATEQIKKGERHSCSVSLLFISRCSFWVRELKFMSSNRILSQEESIRISQWTPFVTPLPRSTQRCSSLSDRMLSLQCPNLGCLSRI